MTWRVAAAAGAIAATVTGFAPAMASAAVPPDPQTAVVVRALPGAQHAAEQAVRDLGGRVVRSMAIINGFEASLGRNEIGRLAATSGVVSVTPDGPLHLLSSSYDASKDPNSAYNVEKEVGARYMWTKKWTGKGIDVALIDSGVTPVPGLDNPGQIVNGPDLTEESQDPALAHLDTFGHGTFMASIIAGHEPGVTPNDKDTVHFMGVAPDARIISVKVADAHGMTDVSQVIAGISWVVQHAHDPGLNIRVLNLSFGTDSAQSYQVDPLAFAAEVAWRAGIVVVCSAGNSGDTFGQLTMPAADPYLMAVGAVDMNGQMAPAGATIPSFSSYGDGVRDPDFVAPGAHIQGLRVPGSYVDDSYSSTGAIDDRFFRGSGTSEAAAFVSGAVAELLQQRPTLTPDQVKCLLVATANPAPNASAQAQGAGIIDVKTASGTKPAKYLQGFAPSTGTGSLDASRGSHHLVLNGSALTGEQDIWGAGFDSAAVAAAEANGTSWVGGDWNGHTWSGATWSGNDWTGHTWSGNDWTGHTWSSDTWSTGTWDGHTWSSTNWSTGTWDGATWSSGSWASDSWSTGSWS